MIERWPKHVQAGGVSLCYHVVYRLLTKLTKGFKQLRSTFHLQNTQIALRFLALVSLDESTNMVSLNISLKRLQNSEIVYKGTPQ